MARAAVCSGNSLATCSDTCLRTDTLFVKYRLGVRVGRRAVGARASKATGPGDVYAAVVTARTTLTDVQTTSDAAPGVSVAPTQHTTNYEHHGKWNVRWFSKAVEEIVRRLDGTPASDQFTQVVKVAGGDEAVILVKKIVSRMDLDAHHISVAGGGGNGNGNGNGRVRRENNKNGLLALAMASVDDMQKEPLEMSNPEQAQVEQVCQELLYTSQSRLLVNSGRVGDCCDVEDGVVSLDLSDVEEVENVADIGGLPTSSSSSSSSSSSRRSSRSFHGFWGVVVQTKARSSVEGCYLLKAGCSVVARGCSCTHFTLTRVEEPSVGVGLTGAHSDGVGGEYVPPVADQFVESWRTRRSGFDV